MGFLADKKVLITGMLSNRSIAYGIAKAMRREGASLAFTYQGDGVKDRVLALGGELGSDLIFACDVTSDEQIDRLYAISSMPSRARRFARHTISAATASARSRKVRVR
jgi:enoyl-[acyl-carrier protein] reductase I